MISNTYKDFLIDASKVLEDANANDFRSGVLVVNLENLPELDGVLGYDEVDEILTKLVLTVRNALNPSDIVGPSGRYQICCLLPNIRSNSHIELAAHKLVRVLEPPFKFKTRRISVLPRIGLALNENKQNTLSQLMCNASSGLYQAMRNKKNIGVFDEKERNLLLTGIDFWSELYHAIEDGDLRLAYQPQLWAETGKIRSTEALLRWNHPTQGMISPDKLVKLAEGTELMTKLTVWVINTAFRQCAEYRNSGLDIGVSINLSAGDLNEPELAEFISQALDIWQIPADEVILELTETAIMDNHTDAVETLHVLKDIGFKIAMDDFGTGYSSMERLLTMPLDEIKIDRMFVKEMMSRESHDRIVNSMISLGHHLGLEVVAEGVEDDATYERLKAIGCDVIQGFFISSAVSLDELIKSDGVFK